MGIASVKNVGNAVAKIGSDAAKIPKTNANYTTGWATVTGIGGTAISLGTLASLNDGGRNAVANVLPGSGTMLGMGFGALMLGRYLGGAHTTPAAGGITGAGAGLTAAGGATLLAGGGYNLLTWS